MTKKYLMILTAIICFGISANAQLFGAVKKTIHITPATSKIYVDGSEVGNGMYSIKFKSDEDFVMLKFEAPGYIAKEVKLLKNNPNKTISYTLMEDEAMKNSIGGEGIDMANKWFDINVKAGMSEDDAWKRLMSITTKYFDNVEIRDKSAGWIKTAYTVSTFTYQYVRTNVEIKIQFDDDNLKYRARISSEIADENCGKSAQCYQKYDRVLRKYETLLEELQRSLGGNN
jgi:hypothetical protein